MRKLALATTLLALSGLASADIPPPPHPQVINNAGKAIGTVSVDRGAASAVLRVELDAGSLAPGWHGAHVHEKADCSDTAKFEGAGAHAGHGDRPHGLLNAEGHHAGDLPNIFAYADGSAAAEFYLEGGVPQGGAALIIHASPDDHLSQPIGNAGARVACAVLE